MVSVAVSSSAKVDIISSRSLFAVSTEAAAACVSSAWLAAPSAMFVTAVATSPAASDVDWAVAVSSSAVAAVFCAWAFILDTILTRF